MSSIFCCGSVSPYRPQRLQHEQKFESFMRWARFPRSASPEAATDEPPMNRLQPEFAIQIVRQVNYGPLESKRYFIPTDSTNSEFVEVTEYDLIQANFQKLNSYKNWKCTEHDKFFETNVYQKNPVNQHHWRHNIARPGSEIDL
ncbi:MFS multidrug transporter [Sarocladium implicatum]|nr:MFS multidrug transporter [Sarocladium implicatum]